MDDNIIKFPRRDDPPADKIFWQCGCGCMSFELRSDGTILCAQCNTAAGADIGDWRARFPQEPDTPEPPKADGITVVDLNDSAATLRRILTLATADDTHAVIILQDNGEVSTWGERLKTPEESEWFDGRIAIAKKLLTGSGGA